MTGPIAETLARASALDAYLAAELEPSGDGWARASELGSGTQLDAVLDRIGSRAETESRRVQAAFFLCDYAWRIAAPAVTAYLAERRIPDLAPERMLVRFDEDGLTGPPAFSSGSFAALAADPEAAARGAQVVAGETDLLLALRARVEEHLATTIAAVRARSPLGARAQWAIAADTCAGIFLWSGLKLGDQDGARREAEAFVEVARSELRSKLEFVTVEHAGRRETFLRRGSCCLSYQLAAGEYCATCPHVSEAERLRRLRDYLEATHEED